MNGLQRVMPIVGAVATMLLAGAVEAGAADKLAGQIAAFECGDNCYLTIVSAEGTDLTGLCAAPACEPWNAEAMIPAGLIGRSVLVNVGTGEQTDGDGNVMGAFIAFFEIDFID